MADVDTSSYPRPQAPQNPLDQILKVRDTAGALGDIEVGKGIQQAIQPDGSIDRNTLAQVLKGSVAGSMKAPAALTAIEQLRNAGHAADESAIRNQVAQMGYVGQLLGPLADKKTVTKEELVNTAGKAIASATKLGLTGYIPDVAKWLQQTTGNPQVTDVQRAQMVKDHHFQAQTVQRQLEAELPGAQFRSTGQRDVLVPTGSQRNPAFGTTVQQEIPPTATQPGPGNQPTFRGTQPPSTGADVITPQNADITKRIVGGPTSNGQPVTLAQPGDGTRYGVPRGGAAAAAPGAAEAQQAVGAISGKDLAGDLEASKNYQRTVFPLEKAIPALEKLGTTGTGPGTAEVNNVKSFLLSMGVPGINVDKIKNYDEANKYLVDFVNQTGSSGTNDKLAAAFSGNPSTKISNAAATDVAKSALALQKMQRAQLSMFQKSGLPDDQYSKFVSSNALKLDPRAFGIDYMKPDQVKKMIGSLKGDADDIKTEKGKFFYSLREAHDAGLLKEHE